MASRCSEAHVAQPARAPCGGPCLRSDRTRRATALLYGLRRVPTADTRKLVLALACDARGRGCPLRQ
eukprot:scaffold13199_cov98-Isochrysis_galbana.AAC.2